LKKLSGLLIEAMEAKVSCRAAVGGIAIPVLGQRRRDGPTLR
jgi:hypothetical protein